MKFADLRVGDHFIWHADLTSGGPDSINVNLKIAWAEDGSGFAVDLLTREDCISPYGTSEVAQLKECIPGDAPVIKLNGGL